RSPHLSSCLFAATAPAHLYTLSLHDALPISRSKDMTGASMPGPSDGLTAPATGSGTYRSAAPKSAAGRRGSLLVLASWRARCPPKTQRRPPPTRRRSCARLESLRTAAPERRLALRANRPQANRRQFRTRAEGRKSRHGAAEAGLAVRVRGAISRERLLARRNLPSGAGRACAGARRRGGRR